MPCYLLIKRIPKLQNHAKQTNLSKNLLYILLKALFCNQIIYVHQTQHIFYRLKKLSKTKLLYLHEPEIEHPILNLNNLLFEYKRIYKIKHGTRRLIGLAFNLNKNKMIICTKISSFIIPFDLRHMS